MGPSPYTFNGVVYGCVVDADVRVKSDAQITSMMAHRQGYCSERTVYSWVTEDDLEMDLLGAVRDALHANDADHPWLSLSDGKFLRAARLYGRDQLTGERGFNLAAVALLGKEDAILDVMPLYRIDAVLRRVATDRDDDRLVCRSDLVRAYDEVAVFCEKWLPDSFVLDGGSARALATSSSASWYATASSTASSSARISLASRLTERASARETKAARSSPAP